jgi:hypothetical protein
LEIQSVRFVSFSILFFTLHIPHTHAHLPAYCLHCPWYIRYILRRTEKRRRRWFRASASIFRLMCVLFVTTFWNVFLTELRDSILFSVYRESSELSTYTLDMALRIPSLVLITLNLLYAALSEVESCKVWVSLA